jgi:glycosyltransferase involved in cell wall biosynthesis
MPQISVLMPVWNGCRNGDEYLNTAIESILKQTFTDFQFVIVDDGSTDHTSQVLTKYAATDKRIEIFRNETNLKIVKSLNIGLSKCTGRYIARMDADDISTVTRLEVQKDFLDNRPETAMCGSGMYVINHESKLEFEVNHPCNYVSVKPALARGCVFVHGSVMFRKDKVLEIGGYSEDPNVEYAEDYDLWVRLAENNVIENIPNKSLYFHRNHPTKSSNTFRSRQEQSTRNVMDKARRILGV